MFLTAVLLLIFVNNNYCFNIDTNSPFVYIDPFKYLPSNSNKSSYFGYSLVLYPGSNKSPPWVIIGAPRGSNPRSSFRNPGVCFKCRIKEKCELMYLNEQSSTTGYTEKLDDAWIGGSMDINHKYERIVTCAYRWIKIKKKRNNLDDDYHMQGSCYWFHIDDITQQKLLPLFERGQDIYTDRDTKSSVYYYAQGQAGFSVHMPWKEREMLLGAPGVFNWDGTSILYKDGEDSTPVVSKLRSKRKKYAEPDEFSYKNIANAIETRQTMAYDLFGYSSTSGYFYNQTQLLYVSGAPRSNDYKGQVLIYDFSKSLDTALDVRESRSGTQFGEYFGASVTAGDIDNDGFDDLIVGAPFYTATKYNEGKIYIFMGSETSLLQISEREIIIGTSTNGQFGASVQYLGDIDHDGFGDIAVAAPYEDEKGGVLYLYRGTSKGLDTTYCQRIVGRDISPDIRGFGMSISRPADIDLNKYSDIGIGAYLSGHAILLRTSPSVTIYHKLESFFSRLNFDAKSFEMSACFWYKLDQQYDISIRRTIVVDQELGRAHLRNADYVKTIQLTLGRSNCQNFTIELEDSFLNHNDPITISLSHELITQQKAKGVVYIADTVEGRDMFCPRCPVYNKYGSSSTSTVSIPFALGCGSDNVCYADLEFEPKLIDISDNTFVLGSKHYVTLQTAIKNIGELAYLTQVVVTVPEMINFRSIPSACVQRNVSSVSCSVDNPLKANIQKMVLLDLDMTNVNSGKYEESLVITVTVFTSSENNATNVKELVMKLKREADITISGKSGEQSYSYRNVTEGNPNFIQRYQVEKFGSSPLNEISIEINIPHIIRTEDGTEINFISLYPPTGSLADQEVICRSPFPYLVESKKTSETTVPIIAEEDDNFVGKKLLKRSLKEVEVFNKSTSVREKILQENDFDALQNRTFYINCEMSEITCSKVVCTAGPIKSGEVANIQLKMDFNISAIKDLLGKKDVIFLTTRGSVMVTNPPNFVQSGDKSDRVDVITILVGESSEEKVAVWIIVLSIIAGLLLLLLLILGLIKAGFFKRTTKDELEQLKKEIELHEDNDVTDEEEN